MQLPESVLGLWTSDEPPAFLRLAPDGRMTLHRAVPTESAAAVSSASAPASAATMPPRLRGRVRRLTTRQLQVNVWSTVVWRALPLDGAPRLASDGRWHWRVDGIDFVRARTAAAAEYDTSATTAAALLLPPSTPPAK